MRHFGYGSILIYILTLWHNEVNGHEFMPARPWRISNDISKRAFSIYEMEKARITVGDMNFSVPQKWALADRNARADKEILPCIFASAKDLELLATGKIGLYRIYSSVLNATLPFDRTVLDASRLPWDSFVFESRIRIYDLPYSAKEFNALAEKKITAESQRITGKKCALRKSKRDNWALLSFVINWQDDDLFTELPFDFYSREIGGHLLLLVDAGKTAEVAQILKDIDKTAKK